MSPRPFGKVEEHLIERREVMEKTSKTIPINPFQEGFVIGSMKIGPEKRD